MTKLFSAAEILAMNLPNLPTTKKGLLNRAEKEDWHYEMKVGLGGIRKVFKIPEVYLPGFVPPNHDNMSYGESMADFIDKRAEAAAVKTVEVLGDRVDSIRLANAIRYVDSYIVTNGISVKPDRRSEIIVLIYNSMRSDFNEDDVNSLLKLVA